MSTLAQIEQQAETKNRNIGFIVSIVAHLLMVICFFLPLLTFPDPPPPKEGILIALGRPDEGMGDDRPMAGRPDGDLEEKVIRDNPPPAQPKSTPPPPSSKPLPKATNQPKVMTTEDPEAVAIAQSKIREQKRAKDEAIRIEQDQKRQRDAVDKERQRVANEESARNKAKSKYGDLYKNGGTGRGNTNKPGNQGDPSGDPNSDILTGKSTGTGKVGGDLAKRGGKGPSINTSIQEEGIVVIKVCIDANGKVISADYTQSGSTTTNAQLITLAKDNARRRVFNQDKEDKQCGPITYSFILR